MNVIVTKYTTNVHLEVGSVHTLFCDDCVKRFHPDSVRKVLEIDGDKRFYCGWCHEGVKVRD
jgi:hypothetical protein